MRAGLTWKALALAYVALAGLFLLLPVAVLVAYSLQSGNIPFPPFNGPSLKWYGEALANDQYAAGFANSLIVGIGSAALATLLGFFSAYGVARFAFRFKGLVQWLLLAPSMLSFLIIGLGLLVFFKRVGIEPSLAAVIIGHVVINLPVAFAVILAQTGPHQVNAERAARDLGAREWQVLSLVTAPMLKPSIIAAFGLCLSFSWDEFIISFLLTRFDVTLPVAMWASLRGGLSPAVNAAGTLLFLASLIVFVALIMRGLTNRETRLAG